MKRRLWKWIGETLSWPMAARNNLLIRVAAMAQAFLFVLGLKAAFECSGWSWGFPLASIVVYVLTDFVIGAFFFINLMNPLKRD